MTGAGTPGPKPEASFGAVERINEGILGDSETRDLAKKDRVVETGKIGGGGRK